MSVSSRTLKSLAVTAAVTLGVLVPASAVSATPGAPTHTESIAACEIDSSTLKWGTLERWRSYVGGGIANGSWTAGEGVTYEMPQFVWDNGEGIVAVDGTAGNLNYSGPVDFEGHEGLLQVTIDNPTLEIVDDETAYLLLDLSSTDMSGDADISAEQERAVEFELSGKMTLDGDTLTINDAEGELTAAGAAAFGGFYDAGEKVDPLSVVTTAADGCTFTAKSAEEPAEEEPEEETEETSDTDDEQQEPEEIAQDDSGFPVLPIIIGGVALLVIGGAVTMLITGRKKNDPTNMTQEDKPPTE